MPLVTEIQVAGVEDVKSQLADLWRSFREGNITIKELNKQMREIGAPIYAMRRSLTLLRTEWRMQHQTLIATSRVMRDIGYIGKSIISMLQAYQISQIRIAQAQRDVAEATKTVAELQDRYNRYLEVFGEDSVFTKRAYEELQEAIENKQRAIEEVNRALQEQNLQYIGIGLSMGSFISQTITAIGHLKELTTVLGGVAGALGAIGAVIAFGLAYREYIAEPAKKEAKRVFGEQWEKMHPMQRKYLEDLFKARRLKEVTGGIEGGDIFSQIGNALSQFGKWLKEEAFRIPGFQLGGIIPATGLYRLHAGELVIPANKVIERTTPKTIQIRNTFYINNISSQADIEELSERVSAKTLEKLGEKL